MQNAALGCPLNGLLKEYHKITRSKINIETKPFTLIVPCERRNLVFDNWRDMTYSLKQLQPGMVLFKNYLTLRGQVDIFNICEKWGVGPGGFYVPRNQDGAKLQRHMMCFGRNWDPVTKYDNFFRSHGSQAPPLPYELISLAQNLSKDLRIIQDLLFTINFCVVNYYSIDGRLDVDQDCDESIYSLERGSPVVSISIGDIAEFYYGDTREEDKLNHVLLESGDVLIFGGKSRHIFHGVKRIWPGTRPIQLFQETHMIPGRLNLTLRQAPCSSYG
ncbi:hypothetical protein QVD17_10735 [Tagetes erecta]|uniref:Fe2OG dioxygenase domain-containing protein n=1 Tax=Tagetes erecta TaxID=13708 RepID=A0AAD8P529_TARER|nr:hypothetical protein QVD17_10735 [Tagetes erecta]